MKKSFLFLFLLCWIVPMTQADEVTPFYELVRRVAPGMEQRIDARLLHGGEERFVLRTQNGRPVIEGTSVNALAVGLNYYLKYFCLISVSWMGEPVQVPDTLPVVDHPISIRARVSNRFFLNYCTFGYTMVWWGWKEWERMIDWMALNGVNLPLAITGQESIWWQVWQELGLTDTEIRRYFTGPAHLPWHRMLNIDSWQGDVPMVWLEDQLALQKQITARERELGMRPVLPAFSGHVPAALATLYPEANIQKLSRWCGFDDAYICSYLDPEDSLFAKIQKLYLEKQEAAYGTSHVYGIDLFNEVDPPSYEPDYLARVSRATYQGLQQADPDAVWLQMTWLFYCDRDKWTNERIQAYVNAVPKRGSLLLDYYCEKTEVWRETKRFFGMPYVWCYLGNFGGNTALIGNIDEVNQRIENAFNKGGRNMQGIGCTLEGLDCNEFMYEYVLEKAWTMPTQDVDEWVNRLADRHIGKHDKRYREAWQILHYHVYHTVAANGQGSLMQTRPALDKKWTTFHRYAYSYNNDSLFKALELMQQAGPADDRPFYNMDCLNVYRQWMGNRMESLYDDWLVAYHAHDSLAVKRAEEAFLCTMMALDNALCQAPYFSYQRWIEMARAKGVTEEEKAYFEHNARTLLTTWGDKGSPLTDYACRMWGGLIRTYYIPRWQLFFRMMEEGKSEKEFLEIVQLLESGV